MKSRHEIKALFAQLPKAVQSELLNGLLQEHELQGKILSSLEQLVPEQLCSEVECDELELAMNNKGSRNLDRKSRKRGGDFKRNMGKEEVTVIQVVTAVERKGEKYLKTVVSKRLSKKEIAKALDGKLAGNTTLITDKHPSFKAFAKDNPGIKHKALLAKDHVDKNDKTIHLQKVNNVHAELRKFLRPFNGVSSKYLQNYLNWYAYADKIEKAKQL
ncbi:MAG: IS1595 family transposase [Bacteroidales bacterium]|nr:IS1595 family transposase [Bacteroidales bacterium]